MITVENNIQTVNGIATVSQTYWGLSTDSKPTSGVGNGSIFIEINTGKVYFFNGEGAAWVEQFSFQS